ncbi:hypothetical protein AK812_SmicGene33257 [Symbiodinium microadriaticum]|uniref:Uncharacterized protein n=1 Tax=Symbiodinium microadriaticum TaxID=2951 RepID=A0A1Q9CS43_SYMMI|nr:hypothetical protein AK812_SmicGene33257 [Symbiodinium microadriaticum]
MAPLQKEHAAQNLSWTPADYECCRQQPRQQIFRDVCDVKAVATSSPELMSFKPSSTGELEECNRLFAMRAHMGDDFPLLASPAPHVGQVSPVPRASPGGEANSGAWNRTLSWKRLLVNSPPAWAASPDKYMGRMGVEGSPGEGSWPSWRSAPPFPAPSLGPGPGPNPPRLPPNLRQEGEGKFSQDEEDEISRFLSHVSISPTAYAEDIGKLGHEPPPKTPSPRRRGFRDAQDDTLSTAWTPFSALNTSGQDSGFATEGPSGAFLEGPASTGSQRMQRPRGSGQGAADHSTLLQTSSPAGPSSPGVAADTQTNPTIELGEVLPAWIVFIFQPVVLLS